jgi:aspartate/methionine/tyrosine aminotransferase
MKRFDGTDATILTRTQFIHEWVHHLKSEGHDIIDASRGRPSFPVDDDTLDAMKSALDDTYGSIFPYGTDALGEPSYRSAVANSLSEFYRMEVEPEQIIFTPGGQFFLYLTFKILHEQCPEGVFVTTSPGYLNYEELIKYASKEGSEESLLKVELARDKNYLYSAKSLKEALNKNTKPISAFIFCNPLNPSGQVITRGEWLNFVELLHEYDAPIIMDEAFIETVFSEDKDCSLLHVDQSLRNRIILLRSGTKAHGLSGERLCVAIVPKSMIEKFRFHQSRLLGNPPLLAQAGMAAAIKGLSETRIDNISRYYAENANKLMAALDDIIGSNNYIKPDGGFFLLADFKHLLGKPMPLKAKTIMHIENDFIETDRDIMVALMLGIDDNYNKGAALIPGSYFGLSPHDGIMRISYSISRDEGEQLIERLSDMCGNKINFHAAKSSES